MSREKGRARFVSILHCTALCLAGLTAPLAKADLIYTWGFGANGQLGVGSTGDSKSPLAVTSLASGVSGVSAGGEHSLAVKNGAVFAWGYNFDGELGNGTTTDQHSPVALTGSLASGVTAVAAGNLHSLAIRSGALYAWGYNGEGELGDGSTTAQLSPEANSILTTGVTAIAAGADFSLALRNSSVYSWGNNTYGQLGNGSTTATSLPALVSALSTGVTAIASGAWHNLALKNGSLYAWGDNAKGQLGDGTLNNRSTPTIVNGFASAVTSIAGGWGHSLVVQNGSVYGWGSNYLGQLGDGTSTDSHSPERIDSVDLNNIAQVAASQYSSYALSSDGSLWSWGWNANGQLGINSSSVDFRTPQQLLPPSGYVYTSIGAGALGSHVVATLAPVAVTVTPGPAYHFPVNPNTGILVRTTNGILINANSSAILDTAPSHANRQLLVDTSVLNLVGYAGHWSSRLDVGNNDLDLQESSLAKVVDQVRQGFGNGSWNGTGGLISSAAAANPNHLTTLAVIQNNQSGTAIYTSTNKFDGTTPGASDILVKYTYFGDSNLDGKVDGSDYSAIDFAFQQHGQLTGWLNGDYNYDGTINGSDYSLIDNAFNRQTTLDASMLAMNTALLAPTAVASVPEPTGFSLFIVGALGMFSRRRRSENPSATHASKWKDSSHEISP